MQQINSSIFKVFFRNSLDAIVSFVKDLIDITKRTRLLMTASSLAYTTILSILPLLAVSFAIFQAFGGMQKMYAIIEPLILSNLAEGTSDEVTAKLQSFISNIHTTTVGVGGLIALILTSISMLSSAEKAINAVWEAPIRTSWFYRIASYWLFITMGPIALSVGVGVATSNNLPLMNLLPGGFGVFMLSWLFFFAVYHWVPHTKVNWKCSLIAGAIVAAFWDLARVGYQVYTAKVVSYNKVYGSLGAVPIILFWIYICWIMVLMGAAITVALQKRLKPSQ